MQVAPTAPAHPLVRYYGGKAKIVRFILAHLPAAHECYCEPYGGAASVLLYKPRRPLEVYNDLNGAVVNLFRVLREHPDELIRAITLTPWARAEYELAQEPSDDPVEEARRFYVSCWQGFVGGGRARRRQGWRYQVKAGTLWKPSSMNFRDTDHLWTIVDRLRGVQIECRPALDVIRQCDAPTTLFYLDPPYLHSTRSKWKHIYAVEMSDEDHVELAELARSLQGMVIISGYPSDLYADLYEAYGWVRKEFKARTNGGGAITSAERTEAIWISPHAQEALEKERRNTQRARDRRELPLLYWRSP